MKERAAPAQAEQDLRIAPTRYAQQPAAERGERLLNQRGTALAQRQLGELVQRAPRVVQQRQLAHSIDTSPRMVAQAAGFKSVNKAAPKNDDPVTGAFATAGEQVWGSVFTDNKIDEAGGIIGEYTPGGADIDAEAETRYEVDEVLPDSAFARVTVTGGGPTTMERWSQAIVVNNNEVTIPPNFFTTNRAALLAQILLQLGNQTRSGVPSKELDDLCVDLELDDFATIEAWCATSGGAPDWLPAALLDATEAAATKYLNKLTDDSLSSFVGYNQVAALSRNFFTHLTQTYQLVATSSTQYVKANTPLTLRDVVMHEFGHVHAGLQVTPDELQAARAPLAPSKVSILKVADELLAMTNAPDTLNRKRVTELRFAWADVVTAGTKTQAIFENGALMKALKTMANVLMSFEEFFNIQAIDNTLSLDIAPATPATHKRLTHGTENRAAADIGSVHGGMANLNALVASKAGSAPNDMARDVWIAKLKTLVTGYKAMCVATL